MWISCQSYLLAPTYGGGRPTLHYAWWRGLGVSVDISWIGLWTLMAAQHQPGVLCAGVPYLLGEDRPTPYYWRLCGGKEAVQKPDRGELSTQVTHYPQLFGELSTAGVSENHILGLIW